MTDKALEELMWQRIDGTISPQDRHRLDEAMRDDPRVRSHFEELTRFATRLDGFSEVEPPPALRKRIDASIDPNRYAVPVASPSIFHKFFSTWRLDYAAVAAAGVLVGVIGYHIVNYAVGPQARLDKGGLYGTLISDPGNRLGSPLRIDLKTVQGTIDFRHIDDLAVSVIDITSQREIDVLLEYDGQPVEFAARGSRGQALERIEVSDRGVVIRNLGSGRYHIAFSRSAGGDVPLSVQVVADEALLLERNIRPDAGR